MFIDPVIDQIEAAKMIHADMIEIHTGEYAEARTSRQRSKCLQHIASAARYAHDLGLTVNAGHGLHYDNISGIKKITTIEEVSIGHAVIAHAVRVGLEQAVKELVRLVK